MNKTNNILTTYWFIAGLTILLLNDFVLKELYVNWFTGKLSDFAGLFIFPLFWTAIFPKYKNHIFAFTALFFIYWKSQYSQALIDNWNMLGLIAVSRVVDYSDLLALLILPAAFHVESNKEKKHNFRLSPIIPLFISTFAFAATSQGPRTRFYDGSTVYHVKHFSRDSLIHDLESSGLDVSFKKYGGTNYDNEHAEISHINDSIQNMEIFIKDFRSSDSTVEITLQEWRYKSGSDLKNLDEKEVEKHRKYVKQVFEQEVLTKLNMNQ